MSGVRVLVVDDSAFMRKMIPQILRSDPEIEVVGTAMDGLFALKKIRDLRPDVVTLDVNMPRMNGIETLRHIVEDFGIPAVMVSSLTRDDAESTFRALEMGAFDFIAKPRDAISVHIQEIGEEPIRKIRSAAKTRRRGITLAHDAPPAPLRKEKPSALKDAAHILAIGASTGGPNVLSYLLTQLPEDYPAAIVIVQHMPPGFTQMFAQRLDAQCRIQVKEAADGDLVLPGRALIAPGDLHMRVRRLRLGSIAVLSGAAPVNGHRPSVDVLFSSVAAEFGKNATALIMTGMGNDGAEGAGEIRSQGGRTIAQDEQSCVVFGMPRAAIERNHIDRIVSLEDMGNFFNNLYSKKEDQHGTAVP